MRLSFTAIAVGVLALVLTSTASAQPHGSRYSGGNYYSVPSNQRYYQPVYPSYNYAQPQYSGSFNYSTPSFGFGIDFGPSYGSRYGDYYRPISPGYGHHHHHHHGHHHHGHR